MTAKYLQDLFDAPVFIQLSTDEKYLCDGISLEEVEIMARGNAADIMSLGLNPEKTIIISNFEAIKQLYPTTMDILRHITIKQMMATFGIKDGDNSGNYYFPAIEAAPAFSSALRGVIENHPRCLVVLGLDQDPYFRLARDVAHCLKQYKPALIHTSFIPGLKDIKSKMSSSDPTSAIFLSNTDKQIHHKIMRYAFSGGCDTAEEQRKLGADTSIDVSCRYLRIFGSLQEFTKNSEAIPGKGDKVTFNKDHRSPIESQIDFDLNKIIEDYSKGLILTGELKNILSGILYRMIKTFQQNRVNDSVLDTVMSLRNITH